MSYEVVDGAEVLPVSISSFSMLRESGMAYVDKTDMICALARFPRKYFLARPRRFGKSLLISTFESLFRDGLKHFKGLKAERLWKDTGSYNVVHLDFSELREFRSFEDFRYQLASLVISAFKPLGFQALRSRPEDTFRLLSDWCSTQKNSSLVLLVDEYDAPLVSVMHDESLFDDIRSELNKFYIVFKHNDGVLRFMFITGIVKFSQTGVFSVLNQLKDISLNPDYGTLLGYTEDEIRENFPVGLSLAARGLGMALDQLIEKLRRSYDGFCFDELVSTHVFAPWSVLSFLEAPKVGFKNYWATSGAQASVVSKYLDEHFLSNPCDFEENKTVDFSSLDASNDLKDLDETSLLVETGYLTLKERKTDAFIVGYPNEEVASSMAQLYGRRLLRRKTLTQVGAGDLAKALATENVDSLFRQVNCAFTAIDYLLYPIVNEAAARSYFQIFLAGAGCLPRAEIHNALGRSDLEFDAGSKHWVIELKFLSEGEGQERADQLLEEALEQIQMRRYGEASEVALLRVGAVFSEKTRSFSVWKVLSSEIG